MHSRIVVVALLLMLIGRSAMAQQPDTTRPTAIDPELEELANARNPREYTIAGITVTGTKYRDESLLLSISGLSVGDKVVIPGSDNFSKAITNLWKQNLFSNVEIYYTKVQGRDLYIEIHVTERPSLSNFTFKGVKKSEQEDLAGKTGLVKGRVITENMKKTAVENIIKYYVEKGFQGAQVTIEEQPDPAFINTQQLTFRITKGNKVRINQISFFGNEQVNDLKLKKKMKGTKEITRLTLFPKAERIPERLGLPLRYQNR
jgi:outer membrane protein insertion porin family